MLLQTMYVHIYQYCRHSWGSWICSAKGWALLRLRSSMTCMWQNFSPIWMQLTGRSGCQIGTFHICTRSFVNEIWVAEPSRLFLKFVTYKLSKDDLLCLPYCFYVSVLSVGRLNSSFVPESQGNERRIGRTRHIGSSQRDSVCHHHMHADYATDTHVTRRCSNVLHWLYLQHGRICDLGDAVSSQNCSWSCPHCYFPYRLLKWCCNKNINSNSSMLLWNHWAIAEQLWKINCLNLW